jgi:hypothetical protein
MSPKMQYINDVVMTHEGSDCLIWPFYRNNMGYASVAVAGLGTVIVSRYVCKLVNGPPPTPKYQAAHSCGRGKQGCVSPQHLSWKTRLQNEADKIIHGTRLYGENCTHSKLTNAQVAEIFATEGVTHLALAAKYGVSRTAITNIKLGRRWIGEAIQEQPVRQCNICGQTFIGGRPYKKYCSLVCRRKQQKSLRQARARDTKERAIPEPEPVEEYPETFNRRLHMRRIGSPGW